MTPFSFQKLKFWIGIFLLPVWAFAQGSGGGKGGQVAVQTGPREVYMSAGYLGLSASATQYDIAPGFQLLVYPKINWATFGGELIYQKIAHQGGATSNVQVMLGPTINMGGTTLNECFFASLGAMIKMGSTDLPDTSKTDPNGFGFYFLVGRRIPIGGAFTLRPSLGVLSSGTTGFVFRPFALSYYF